MPLIRYRLDDRSQIIGDRCPECGRNNLLLGAVTGHRIQDAIIGFSGTPISMTALNMHDDTFASVRQFQFYQREPGKVTLYLRVDSSFDDERRGLILKSLRRKTRDDIDYDIKTVESIQTTDIGKGVYLRQEIRSANQPST
jgi:phenylacetate-coenzyme A ligase PaaK-like adenylate-forming protein